MTRTRKTEASTLTRDESGRRLAAFIEYLKANGKHALIVDGPWSAVYLPPFSGFVGDTSNGGVLHVSAPNGSWLVVYDAAGTIVAVTPPEAQ